MNACSKVIASGAKADCTLDCLSKLTAATQSISGLSTCVCPTADKACTMSQQNFKDAECYGKGHRYKLSHNFLLSISQANCSYAAIQCIQDKACNQSFQQYNTACASAYASGLSSDCTSQCNTSLADALARQPNLGTCVCTDYACSIGQRNLVKACHGKKGGPHPPRLAI